MMIRLPLALELWKRPDTGLTSSPIHPLEYTCMLVASRRLSCGWDPGLLVDPLLELLELVRAVCVHHPCRGHSFQNACVMLSQHLDRNVEGGWDRVLKLLVHTPYLRWTREQGFFIPTSPTSLPTGQKTLLRLIFSPLYQGHPLDLMLQDWSVLMGFNPSLLEQAPELVIDAYYGWYLGVLDVLATMRSGHADHIEDLLIGVLDMSTRYRRLFLSYCHHNRIHPGQIITSTPPSHEESIALTGKLFWTLLRTLCLPSQGFILEHHDQYLIRLCEEELLMEVSTITPL